MAFPTILGSQTWLSDGANTSHEVTLPSGTAPGDVLLCLFSAAANPTITPSAGWTKHHQQSNGTNITGAILSRVAQGGDALTVSLSSSRACSAITYRLSPGAGLVGHAAGTGSAANSRPPYLWVGEDDYLWLAARHGLNVENATAPPSSFEGLLTVSATLSSGASTAAAHRAERFSALWPLAFSVAARPWVCYTLALTDVTRYAVATVAAPLGALSLQGVTWSVRRALVDLASPLGRPVMRGRRWWTRVGLVQSPAPLGAPAVVGTRGQIFTAVTPAVAQDAAPRRLLSDSLPLRRAIEWPGYRADAWLPWVYGRVTLAPLALDDGGYEWLLADHPIVGVTRVTVGDVETSGWQLIQRLDQAGRAIATLRLAQRPKDGAAVAVTVAGRRDDESGALLEQPAEIAADLLRRCGWPVSASAFSAVAARWPGVLLGGVIAEPMSLREAVSVVLGTVGADWSAEPVRAWPVQVGAPSATLGAALIDEAQAEAGHEQIATRLRITFGYDWARRSPRGAVTLLAPDVAARVGVIDRDLDLAWVRAARDALALGTAELQRRARPQWQMELALPAGSGWRPGDILSIDHPWVPSGPALVSRLSRSDRRDTLTLMRPAGLEPRVELAARGSLVDPAAAEQPAVIYRDGQATFTVLNDIGEPLAAASVTLDGMETRVTDRQGRVTFTTTRGPHTLLVVAAGYLPFEMDVVV